MSYQVPLSTVPLLQDPPFVVILMWLSAAIGYRVLRLLNVPFTSVTRLERGVLSVALGIGLLQYFPFALGITGHLTPHAIRIGMLALLIIFGWDMFLVARGCLAGIRGMRTVAIPNWMLICAVAIAIPLAMAFVRALLPPCDGDGLIYHLNGPKRWLQMGHMGYIPLVVHANSFLGQEMLFTIALAIWSDTSTKLIHYALCCLVLVTLFVLGRRLKSPEVGFAAAALFLVSPVRESVIEKMAWAYVDMGFMFEVVCCVLAWLTWRRTRSLAWLICAAMCAGFAMSFKMMGLYLIGSVSVAILMCRSTDGDSRDGTYRFLQNALQNALKSALLFVGIAILMILPWLWYCWNITGNPVSPALATLIPTHDWGAEVTRAFDSYFKYYVWGDGLKRHLGLQTRMIIHHSAVLLAIAICTGIYWKWRSSELRALWLVTSLLLILSLWTFGLYPRFLFPAVGLSYILACTAGAKFLFDKRWPVWGLTLYLVMRALSYAAIEAHTIRFAWSAATGHVKRQDYLANDEFPYNRVWNYANNHLPSEAVLLSYSALSYYSDRLSIPTEAYHQEHIHFDEWQHFLADVQHDHIGYLICQNSPDPDLERPDYLPARNEYPFLRRLAREHGTLIYSELGCELYRLTLPSP